MTKLRNAFTLVELVISIFLLGLIVNFLYSAISNLQKSNKIFNTKNEQFINEQKLLDILYDDIFLAQSIKITGLKDSFLDLRTANSIYDIDQPYVTWLLDKNRKTLLRFESTQPFKNMTSDNKYLYHISKVAKECEKFKIYKSKDKDNILIFIKLSNKKPLIYEFFKPMSIVDTNSTKKRKIQNKNANNKPHL